MTGELTAHKLLAGPNFKICGPNNRAAHKAEPSD
jgi:hypothetical protein